MKIIEENYEEIKRIAYSIQLRKVSSSLILGKLGSYARKNNVATALRELGRIEKSIFMISYTTDDELRRKITHGLNKTEAVNALAREFFFWSTWKIYGTRYSLSTSKCKCTECINKCNKHMECCVPKRSL